MISDLFRSHLMPRHNLTRVYYAAKPKLSSHVIDYIYNLWSLISYLAGTFTRFVAEIMSDNVHWHSNSQTSASIPTVGLFKASVEKRKVKRKSFSDLRQDHLFTKRGHFVHPCGWDASPCGKHTHRRRWDVAPCKGGNNSKAHKRSWEM